MLDHVEKSTGHQYLGELTSARASADSGVSSAGLTTTVQPAARAAPTFLVIMALGKFHCGAAQTSGRLQDVTEADDGAGGSTVIKT